MNSIEPSARMPSEAPDSAGAGQGLPPSPGGAVGFLLARGFDPRRELRRITFGLIALGAISLVLINLGVYQSASTHLSQERWRQLVAQTEEKRTQVEALLSQFRQSATYVVGQPVAQSWAREALQASP